MAANKVRPAVDDTARLAEIEEYLEAFPDLPVTTIMRQLGHEGAVLRRLQRKWADARYGLGRGRRPARRPPGATGIMVAWGIAP